LNEDIYRSIREENIEKYGTAIDEWGPVLLANRYSDRTHFVYELLQNAEDACERAKETGEKKTFWIEFELKNRLLEVKHNGIPFNYADVRGICGLVEGTKRNDHSQIGQFGIGFKSVYAYTMSPEVYSDEHCFKINNYVQPTQIQPKKNNRRSGETLFIIPFNHREVTEKKAFSEIEIRLKNLGLRTLLFLNNLEKITWKIKNSYGIFSRKTRFINNKIRYVELKYLDDENNEESETWLVFRKPIKLSDIEIDVEIAYLMNETENTNEKEIIPARNTELVVFFPTEKETHLHFLVQGPYLTTPSRDNIILNDWNKMLIEETALLVADSISMIKEMNLLSIRFLNTLPIEKEFFLKEETIFYPIYQKVKEKFLEEVSLIPSEGGGYCSIKNSLIGTAKSLRDLLSTEQLKSIFNKEEWVFGDITFKRTPKLYNYFKNELNIEEVDPEKFARKIDKKFLKDQSDKWISDFYSFLLEQRALWRKKSTPFELEGILLSKPIIRLENNVHITPYNSKGSPNAYLPSSNQEINTLFPIVKKSILTHKKAKEFLENLGYIVPDKIAGLIDKVIPLYQGNDIKIPYEENLQHVKWIVQTLKEFKNDSRRNRLLKILRDVPFLSAKNVVSAEIRFIKPKKIYLGKFYTKNDDIEIFFNENSDIWLLYEKYEKIFDKDIFIEIGCKHKIKIMMRVPNWDGNIIIIKEYGKHKRGLNGFDPDFMIDGLEFALNNINLKRSKIIWDILKQFPEKIRGIVEFATNQDYKNSEPKEHFSKTGLLLKSHSWVPDRKNNFLNPASISINELHLDLEPENSISKIVADKLEFKTDIEQKYLEQLPPEKQRKHILIEKLYQLIPDEQANKIIQKVIKEQENLKENGNSQLTATLCELFTRSEFKNVIDTIEKIPNFPRISKSLIRIYELSKLCINYQTFNDVITLVEKPSSNFRSFRLRWNLKDQDLPVKTIKAKYLKLNIKHFHFRPAIDAEEKKLGVKLPTDERFYPIYENIIVKGMEKNKAIKKLMYDIMNDGQRDPIVILKNGEVLDGNKRLVSYLLSSLLEEKKKISKALDINSIDVVVIPNELSEEELCEIRNDLQRKSNLRPKQTLGYRDSVETMVNIKRFREKGYSIKEISKRFSLSPKEVNEKLGVITQIDVFLENVPEESRYGIAQAFNLNHFFIRLHRELNQIEHLDLEPTQKIEMKKELRHIMLGWFTNLIDPTMRSNEYIPKLEYIRKMRIVLESQSTLSKVKEILDLKNITKIQRHFLLEDIINQNQNYFSEIEDAERILDIIQNYQIHLAKIKIKERDKNVLLDLLTKSHNELKNILNRIVGNKTRK